MIGKTKRRARLRRRLGIGVLSALSAGAMTSCAGVAHINDQAMLLNSTAAAEAARAPRLPLERIEYGEYRIGPRDLLEIDVFELERPDETKKIKVRVGEQGTVLLPLIGALQVSGRTIGEVKASIEDRLRRDFILEPSVSVLIGEYKSRRVTVLGEVRYPGAFDLTQNATTLVNALALAGGPTGTAGRRLFVLRSGGPAADAQLLPAPAAPARGTYVDRARQAGLADELGASLDQHLLQIDLTDLVEHGNMALNCTLQDGDVIHVPKAELCFVTGMVHYPGAFPMREKMTILRALAQAGGMRDSASPSLTVLLRMTETGRQTVPIDLERVRAGTSSDLELLPGDVLVLNQSTGSKVGRGFLEFFRGIFTVGYAVK